MAADALGGPGAVVVRRVRPDEGPLLRAVRLRALADSPGAFGQRLTDARVLPDAEWRTMARESSSGRSRAWFLAYEADEVVGIVLGRRRPPATLLIFSMWVDPRARRLGVGRRLIEAAEDWARSWAGRATVLWVIDGNEPAMRFYERLGFRVVTTGPDAESGAAYGSRALTREVD